MNADGDIYGTQLDLIADSRLPAFFAPGIRLYNGAEGFLAWYDGSVDAAGDYRFKTNALGPVIHDQSDGHTYRIISTAGVLGLVELT